MKNYFCLVDPYYNDLKEFNEKNIKNYKYPFGQMAREVLDDYPASDVI